MKVAVYNATGVKQEDKQIKSEIFEAAVNPALIHEVVVAQTNNRRLASAKTKTRAEISGGGKKPHKQKGTGRARSGSNRNPLWRGGGTVFGPTGIQNFVQNISKKKKRAAIISALATKKDSLAILESFKATKTKEFAEILGKVTNNARTLMVFEALAEKDVLASRNLPKVKVIDYRNLNVYDVLNAEVVVFVGAALDKTNEFWGPSTSAQAKGGK